MGILQRILGRPDAPETRDAAGLILGNDPWRTGLGADLAGRPVSPGAAESIAAVMAAVGAISSAVANLAPLAFRRQSTGRAELPPGHWLPRLLAAPSERFSYPEWAEQVIADCLLRGNSLCEIITDRGGRVVGLEPIGWHRVSVVVLGNGKVAYDVQPPDAYWSGASQTRRLLAGEVLHLRDRVDAGEVVARSRLSRAAGAMSNIASLQAMSEAVWQQGLKPSGIISAPQTLTTAQRSLAETLIQRFAGARATGRPILMEAGWKFESAGIDAESSQTIESRRFSVFEAARVFGVPPPMLQSYEYNTFTNAEQAGKWFGQHTVAPWARKLEAALGRCVIGAGSDLSVELDLSSLLKGSELERMQAFKIASEIGAVSPDEVRQELGWGPRAQAAPQQQETPG
jgi:HK97 family phage portal protein